jgi:hypothetical protein
MLRRFLPAIAMAGLLILGLSGRAHANLQVTLAAQTPAAASASTPVTVGNGDIAFNLTSGIFNSQGNGHGETSASVNTPATMDLSTVTVSSTAAGTVELVFSMNGVTTPVGAGTISESITGQVVQATGSIGITYQTKGDNTNTLYDSTLPSAPFQASLTTTATPTGINPPTAASGAFTATNPYSLTEVLTLTFNTAGTATLSLSSDSKASFTAVPEPTTTALAFTGLPVLGLLWARRRRQRA